MVSVSSQTKGGVGLSRVSRTAKGLCSDPTEQMEHTEVRRRTRKTRLWNPRVKNYTSANAMQRNDARG